MLRRWRASQSTSDPTLSSPLHPSTLNNKGKNMSQFFWRCLLNPLLFKYKFCICICFNIRITFFSSEKIDPPQEVASSLFTDLPHHTPQVCGHRWESPHLQMRTQKPTERLHHLPEVTQRVRCRVRPGTGARALLGPSFLKGPAFDTVTPSSFLTLVFLLPLPVSLIPSCPSPSRGLRVERGEGEPHQERSSQNTVPWAALAWLLSYIFSFLWDQRFRRTFLAVLD